MPCSFRSFFWIAVPTKSRPSCEMKPWRNSTTAYPFPLAADNLLVPPRPLFWLGLAPALMLGMTEFRVRRAFEGMIEISPRDTRSGGIAHIGTQPIALAAGALVVLVLGIGAIALWRAYTGTPEPDRVVAARQLQARTAQTSEQLVEKTKGLEVTQQELIDQLQVVQDQLQTVRRQLAAQQAETRRLSEQVSGLTEAIDGLRQSFASVQGTDTPAATRNKPLRTRSRAAARHRHAGSHG